MDFLTLHRHKTQFIKRSFDARPLIFELQQEVLKFNNICMIWSSPKTDLVTNLLDLENREVSRTSVFLSSNLYVNV